MLGWLQRHVRDLRYDVVRRDELPDGYVQQHVLARRSPTAPARPACMVVAVRDGRIARIDEYLDSAHVRALRP